MSNNPKWFGPKPKFLTEYPQYRSPTGSVGECYDASINYIKQLDSFKPASLVMLEGYKGNTDGALWKGPTNQWCHTIVMVYGAFIDWTPSQFDPKHSSGRTISHEELMRDWVTVKKVDLRPHQVRTDKVIRPALAAGTGVVLFNDRFNQRLYNGEGELHHGDVLNFFNTTGFAYKATLIWKNLWFFQFYDATECTLFKLHYGLHNSEEWWEYCNQHPKFWSHDYGLPDRYKTDTVT